MGRHEGAAAHWGSRGDPKGQACYILFSFAGLFLSFSGFWAGACSIPLEEGGWCLLSMDKQCPLLQAAAQEWGWGGGQRTAPEDADPCFGQRAHSPRAVGSVAVTLSILQIRKQVRRK